MCEIYTTLHKAYTWYTYLHIHLKPCMMNQITHTHKLMKH